MEFSPVSRALARRRPQSPEAVRRRCGCAIPPNHAAAAAVLSVLIVAGWIAGCGDGSPATGPPPPPAVTVTHPVRHVVIEWDEYTGTTASPETVNVVARVSGYIESAPFIEGSIVNKGDLLFVIDPRPFQAALDAAKANADKARAQARLAADQLARYTQLLKQGSVSPQDYENVKSASEQANAALAAADAAVESAQLDLEWTRVTAPIKGRIGRKLVTPGNFVNGGAGQATPLTTIQSVDPMYCYFYVNERAVLKYQRLARQRLRPSARETRVPVLMQLPDETDFPHVGVIDFIDNRIDPGTETITVRGLFANPDNRLLPGMFVRVRVPGSGPQPALLIPDVAIGVDQNINYVLVVGPDNTVDRRTVTVGAMFGKLRAIDSGLSEADRVIVEGIQRARPGAKVAPTEKPIPPDELPPPATTMPEPPPLPTTQAAPETAPATQPTPQTAPAAPTTRPLSQAAPAPAAMPPAHDTGHAGSPALILRRARGNPP